MECDYFMVVIQGKSTSKNPWIAALFNFIIPGFGYLYVWEFRINSKTVFGIFLILLQVIRFYYDLNVNEIIMSVIGLIFAFDAYRDANKLTRN